jgi:hypothetical protein
VVGNAPDYAEVAAVDIDAEGNAAHRRTIVMVFDEGGHRGWAIPKRDNLHLMAMAPDMAAAIIAWGEGSLDKAALRLKECYYKLMCEEA